MSSSLICPVCGFNYALSKKSRIKSYYCVDKLTNTIIRCCYSCWIGMKRDTLIIHVAHVSGTNGNDYVSDIYNWRLPTPDELVAFYVMNS